MDTECRLQSFERTDGASVRIYEREIDHMIAKQRFCVVLCSHVTADLHCEHVKLPTGVNVKSFAILRRQK